jgi:isoleucyl-tRNA synthetase
MSQFESHKATRAIESFLIDDFSNWYLRRSRKRLWIEEETPDKQAAYATLYEVFLGLTQLLAPFTPFITEEMYQNLRTKTMPTSVHLCEYPSLDKQALQPDLEEGMRRIKEIVEAGRALRSQKDINVRYPLANAWIIASKKQQNQMKPLLELFEEELNVKHGQFKDDVSLFMEKSLKPNFGTIGPKYKELAKVITTKITREDPQYLYKKLHKDKQITLKINNKNIVLHKEDFTIVETEKPHLSMTTLEDMTLVLDTTVTPELEAEGFARELIRRIQSMRKELALAVEDHISTEISLTKEKQDMLKSWQDHIAKETRSRQLKFSQQPIGDLDKTWTIGDATVHVAIAKQ